jgi:DNA-binding XRE family transcriptional regulator|tara:strand:- start:1967 stop:2161 length:195 start_codon:yes stop_codon:yes gene_type:complete
MVLEKQQLTSRLKELKMSKRKLANELGVTTMTLYNKFENPDNFKLMEIKRMVKIGFLKSIIIEL